ncbi:hypothetical protein F5Y10DRAFT_286855 [Nemania abortiva]|nr:hypothetical protein F5Y10DRAFT_286855 [Nemania abortiva]
MAAATRSRTRSKASLWPSLPTELRLMILKIVSSQRFPGWGSLASVCKEWQGALEKDNFRKMNLGVSCLDDFERFATPQKRELIRHIYLNVELPRYTPTCCPKRGLPLETKRTPSLRDGRIVSGGIKKLFSILSTWRPANHLALEINVYSPSDCEHWFKNIYLSSDNVEYDGDDTMPDVWRAGSRYHDLEHGWWHGQQVRRPPKADLLRLFRPMRSAALGNLPRVKAVTCLIIRRQLRRCIPPQGLGQLLSSFDRLQHIVYEPWDEIDLAIAMRNNLPHTLTRLIVFEDSYKFYDPKQPTYIPSPYSSGYYPGALPSAVFASKTPNLQHLAISFMVNAEELFRHCRSTWSWLRLESLALTSELLQDDWGKREQLENLLCRASVLVQKMPKLRTLVLWNGGKEHACAFIYRVGRDSASITWRGTWRLWLTPRVVKSWQLAASKLPCSEYSELQIKEERIEGVINSHGDAIYHLRLPCQVVEPASLWQIRREGYSLAQPFIQPPS